MWTTLGLNDGLEGLTFLPHWRIKDATASYSTSFSMPSLSTRAASSVCIAAAAFEEAADKTGTRFASDTRELARSKKGLMASGSTIDDPFAE